MSAPRYFALPFDAAGMMRESLGTSPRERRESALEDLARFWAESPEREEDFPRAYVLRSDDPLACPKAIESVRAKDPEMAAMIREKRALAEAESLGKASDRGVRGKRKPGL